MKFSSFYLITLFSVLQAAPAYPPDMPPSEYVTQTGVAAVSAATAASASAVASSSQSTASASSIENTTASTNTVDSAVAPITSANEPTSVASNTIVPTPGNPVDPSYPNQPLPAAPPAAPAPTDNTTPPFGVYNGSGIRKMKCRRKVTPTVPASEVLSITEGAPVPTYPPGVPPNPADQNLPPISTPASEVLSISQGLPSPVTSEALSVITQPPPVSTPCTKTDSPIQGLPPVATPPTSVLAQVTATGTIGSAGAPIPPAATLCTNNNPAPTDANQNLPTGANQNLPTDANQNLPIIISTPCTKNLPQQTGVPDQTQNQPGTSINFPNFIQECKKINPNFFFKTFIKSLFENTDADRQKATLKALSDAGLTNLDGNQVRAIFQAITQSLTPEQFITAMDKIIADLKAKNVDINQVAEDLKNLAI